MTLDADLRLANHCAGWRTQEPDELEPQAERGQRGNARFVSSGCATALAEGLISLSKPPSFCDYLFPDVEAGLKGPQRADADYVAIALSY